MSVHPLFSFGPPVQKPRPTMFTLGPKALVPFKVIKHRLPLPPALYSAGQNTIGALMRSILLVKPLVLYGASQQAVNYSVFQAIHSSGLMLRL